MRGYNGLYLVGNYPDKDTFVGAAKLGLQYFDFLEVGIPFSDPVADGPVISKASDEMISRGFHLDQLLAGIKEIRKDHPDKKICFMTYANIVFSREIKKFAKIAKDAGINGIILPDVPFAESRRFKDVFELGGIDFIHFLTPENNKDQIKKIAGEAKGFLYFVSIRGITGAELQLDKETIGKIELAKKYCRVPVVLGFGIRDNKSARLALDHADGFIIGTKMIELLKNGGMNEYRKFLEEMGGV